MENKDKVANSDKKENSSKSLGNFPSRITDVNPPQFKKKKSILKFLENKRKSDTDAIQFD